MINQKRLIKEFIDLIKIDSISKKEGRIAKYLKGKLKTLGLKVYEDKTGKKIGGESGNIIGFLKSTTKNASTIMLNAHIDTVEPGKNIKPKVKSGLIKSSGKTILGADDKSGVAVILEVLKRTDLLRSGAPNLLIVFTVAEEIGLFGAKNIDRKLLKADFGLSLDGGKINEIINQAPAQDWIEAEVIGRAAHAGIHPEQGINAIKVASVAISKMKLGRIDSETTANIGIIEGGRATNIIPDKVRIKGEARSHNPKKLEKQLNYMVSELRNACRKHKAKLKFKITPAYPAFKLNSESLPIRLTLQAARRLKLKPVLKKTGGGSDANYFNKYGVPTIVIGTGMHNVHTVKEQIKIADMVRSAELILMILNSS